MGEAFGAVRRAMGELVDAREVPGIAVAAGSGKTIGFAHATGHACLHGGPRAPLTRATRFDLASLTKVMATLPCVLAACGDGLLDLDAPVAAVIPGFHDGVTIRHLLCHTSGLPAERPLWRRHRGRREIVRAVLGEPPSRRPGTRVTYSDLGFIVLGELLERVHGKGLADIVAWRVAGPLGLSATGFLPPPGAAVAATELDARGRAIRGTVHDENAAAMGGVAGHAGLFAPLDDVAAYAAEWATGARRLMPAGLAREAVRCHTDGLGGRRGLGWVCSGDPMAVAGAGWPDGTVGHTGFTGTALAVDPSSGRWAVVLTNAVHFGRLPERSRAVRRRMFSLLARSLCV